MQFTPDGAILVTAGLDYTLRLWDLKGRQQIGPNIPVTDFGVAISPDGADLAANTSQGVIRIGLSRADLRRQSCQVAGRDLTATEWHDFVGGSPQPLCPQPS
jgi:WD40 repeat protein